MFKTICFAQTIDLSDLTNTPSFILRDTNYQKDKKYEIGKTFQGAFMTLFLPLLCLFHR